MKFTTTDPEARLFFGAWLRWYMRAPDSRAESQAQLAKLLGITPPAVTAILKPNGGRYPAMTTLLAFRRLVGYPLDHILSEPPPDRRRDEVLAERSRSRS